LRGSREFARLKRDGERRAIGGLVLNWQRSEVPGEVRMGLVTGRRLGGAVVRSRVRRMVREAFRLNRHSIVDPVRMVLVARPSIVGKPLEMVERDLRRCLREAGLWKGTAEVRNPDRRVGVARVVGEAGGPGGGV